MTYRFLCSAALACAITACGDGPSPVGPAAEPPSSARGQGRPAEVDVTFVWEEASALCGFPVQVTAVGKSKLIELPGGRTIATSPGLGATVTNLANGRATTLSITGAWHTTTLANGVAQTVVTGRNLLTDPIAGFVLVRGRFTFAFDGAGNLVQPLAGTGQVTDVCAMLR